MPPTIRSTPWKARRASPPSTTASPDLRRNERVGSFRLRPADPEERLVAERERDDGRGEIRLVAVLVQPHPRPGA